MNKNIQEDFQICISVALMFLIQKSSSLQLNQTYHTFIIIPSFPLKKEELKLKNLLMTY